MRRLFKKTLLGTAEAAGVAPDPQSLSTRYTLGYWHAQYSSLFQDNPPTVPVSWSGAEPIAYWSDLSAAANHLATDGIGGLPVSDNTGGVHSADLWDSATAYLNFTTPLSLAGEFTFIWLVGGHTGASDTHWGWTDGSDSTNNIVHASNTITVYIDSGSFPAAADIPDSSTPVLMALWRTAGNVLKFAATGLPTVAIGTVSNGFNLTSVGGDAITGLYETRKVIAAGCVGADISAGLPTDAFNLGTTLTL